ncbi:MAG: LptF/LptG family permease [Phycisphaeraceae bacterium]
MPWTLYRYILIELLKLLVLTTIVLVTVISFAGAIKPLSEGLLGPASLARFIFFSAPTMLVFALPFAAAFASTLVFIRMAGDNEILACSASGLSYRSILLPPAILGLALTTSLFFMANYVIPYFYTQARQTIEQDIITLLVNDLNAGKSFDRLGDMVVYADHAAESPPPHLPDATLQPSRLIELQGVAVAQLDAASRMRMDVTAERANILHFRDTERSWITIALRETRYYDPSRGTLGEDASVNLGPLELPNPFDDKVKLFSLPQLRAIGQEPERYDDVRAWRDHLIGELSAEHLRQLVQGDLESDATGQTVVLAATGFGGHFALRAPQVHRTGSRIMLLAEGDDPVIVEFAPDYDRENRWRPTRRYEAQQASLSVEQFSPDQDPNLRAELSTVKVFDVRLNGRATERSEMTLPRLLWPEPVLVENPRQIKLAPLLELAEAYRDAPSVRDATDRLQKEVMELGHEITALVHDRAASAVACMMLTLLGAVLSIHLKGQMTLVVYFWSFLLAIVTILLIYAGENVATADRFPLYVGLALLWSGNVLLAVMIGWVYCRLARN